MAQVSPKRAHAKPHHAAGPLPTAHEARTRSERRALGAKRFRLGAFFQRDVFLHASDVRRGKPITNAWQLNTIARPAPAKRLIYRLFLENRVWLSARRAP